MKPTPLPHIAAAPLYIPGAHKAGGVLPPAVLSANENPLGPSPHVAEALKAEGGNLHRYPDGAATNLIEAIGAAHNVPRENIICGAGSDELIGLICRAFIGPGDEMLYSQHGFLMYDIATKLVGGTPVKAPEMQTSQGWTTDCQQIVAKVTPKTKAVFIANPNNPTGSYLTGAQLADLRRNLDPEILLVIDAAYSEYVVADDYDDGKALALECDNVIMLRTFSKAYGLAGVRLGWAVGARDLLDALNRVRSPFNLSSLAQIAGTAAVGDQAYLETSRAHNEHERALMTTHINQANFAPTARVKALPSVGNFFLLDCGDEQTAAALDKALLADGIIIRRMGAYGLADMVRVSVGLAAENQRFLQALQKFLAQ